MHSELAGSSHGILLQQRCGGYSPPPGPKASPGLLNLSTHTSAMVWPFEHLFCILKRILAQPMYHFPYVKQWWTEIQVVDPLSINTFKLSGCYRTEESPFLNGDDAVFIIHFMIIAARCEGYTVSHPSSTFAALSVCLIWKADSGRCRMGNVLRSPPVELLTYVPDV